MTQPHHIYQHIRKNSISVPILTVIFGYIIRAQAVFDEEPAPQIASPQSSSSEALNKFQASLSHVLLADDNVSVRAVVARQIRKHATEVTECEDGLKGWMAYQSAPTRYAFVVLDYDMPHMDGIEVAQSIRQYEQQHSLPRVPILRRNLYNVLVLSGDNDENIKAAASETGIDYTSTQLSHPLVEKPLPHGELEKLMVTLACLRDTSPRVPSTFVNSGST